MEVLGILMENLRRAHSLHPRPRRCEQRHVARQLGVGHLADRQHKCAQHQRDVVLAAPLGLFREPGDGLGLRRRALEAAALALE